MTTWLGWLGTVLVVSAYAGTAWGLLGTQERLYQALNLVGASLLGVLLWSSGSWPAFWLQVVWAGVAIVGLVRGPR